MKKAIISAALLCCLLSCSKDLCPSGNCADIDTTIIYKIDSNFVPTGFDVYEETDSHTIFESKALYNSADFYRLYGNGIEINGKKIEVSPLLDEKGKNGKDIKAVFIINK